MDTGHNCTLVPTNNNEVIIVPPEKEPLQGQLKDGIKAILMKKPLMSFLDTMISVFIVAPCTVACWRGTWNLMNIYSTAFPPLPSYMFGGMFHLCFAIMREGLQVWILNTQKTLGLFLNCGHFRTNSPRGQIVSASPWNSVFWGRLIRIYSWFAA